MKKLKKKLNSLYSRIVKRIPLKFYFPKKYFIIIKNLKKQASGQNIDDIIRKRLVLILKESLIYVPYYIKLNLPINHNNINENNVLYELKKFPYLTKEIVMKSPEDFISSRFNKSDLIKSTSGGSTGRGIKIFRDKKEYLYERAFFDFKWGDVSFKPYMKFVRINNMGKKKENQYPCTKYGGELLISPYHFNEKWIKTIYEEMKLFKVEFIHAYPSSLEYLLQYMLRNDLTFNHLKAIFLGSERVTTSILKQISLIFSDIKLIFHYGLTEMTNLAWGSFNNGKIQYQFENCYGITENLIDEDGNYEIVGTSLWNEAMPLIRYRTQDYGKISKNIIQDLDGRKTEFLITKNNKKIPGFSISIDQFIWDYIEIFQVIQNESGKIEFHIKTKNNFSPEIEKRIYESQKEKWGGFFDIKIIIVKEIIKTKSGKHRLIINNFIKN